MVNMVNKHLKIAGTHTHTHINIVCVCVERERERKGERERKRETRMHDLDMLVIKCVGYESYYIFWL